MQIQKLRSDWEESKANLSPHLASHAGIDSIIRFLEEAWASPDPNGDPVQTMTMAATASVQQSVTMEPIKDSDVPGGLRDDTRLPKTLTEE